MDFRDVLKVLNRNRLLILASILFGVLAAACASLLTTPTYTASTRLFVAIQNTGTVSELQQGNTFSQARVQSYVETARTPLVLQPVIDELGLDATPLSLAEQVSATADLNTVLITLSAKSSSPVEAAAIAQAMTSSLIDAVDDLEGSANAPGTSPVKLSVVTPASAPTTPSGPNIKVFVAAGLVVGLMVGMGISLLKLILDSRIRRIDDVLQVTDVPMLGGIAYDKDAEKKPLLTQVPPQSARAESFRQIRTNFQFVSVESKSNSMLVTSSLPGEGKSTTATNLAIAMAQAGQRVALVDADLRRPMVASYLGLEGNAGLTTVLVGGARVEDLLQPWGEGELHVLTSGQIPPNPSELLGSQAMSALVSRLEDTFDVVVIDAPPLIPVTDATVLSQRVGGVVLVIGAAKVKVQDLEKSLGALRLVQANLLGVITNRLPNKGPDAYEHNYYSYEAESKAKSGRRTRNQSNNKPFDGAHLRSPGRSKTYSD
ncbi:polysaccharide biosynthesis tyrosine autokinase [Arthrobacter sp. G119Y2]|uniref:polysaccharide biosynthesis tyrosine autokinase n=1 Tax=Arthrobacter sp. G119Y2 TaxID=3134965 RepID=UPI00311A1270